MSTQAMTVSPSVTARGRDFVSIVRATPALSAWVGLVTSAIALSPPVGSEAFGELRAKDVRGRRNRTTIFGGGTPAKGPQMAPPHPDCCGLLGQSTRSLH